MQEPDPFARLEGILGRLLYTGVAASATVLLFGLGIFLFAGGSQLSERILAAGLVLLMATPVLRVVVSLVEYIRMRDWLFVCTSLAVLGQLVVTLVYALRRG